MVESKDYVVNLSQPFLYLIKIFYYTGLSTFSRTFIPDNWHKWWHLKWCYFNIILCLATHSLILYFHHELFYIGDRFGQFNDFVKVLTVGVSHMVTLIETTQHQNEAWNFFQIYTRLHQQWTDYRKTKNELKIYKKYFFITSFYILILCIIEFNYIYQIRLRRQWIIFFLAYEPSVFICRFRFLQIAMYLSMITMETLQLNKEITELAKYTRKKQENYNENFVCQKLHSFMQKYQQIYLMVELLKKSCSISFLVIYIKSYIKLLTDSYWFYWVIYNNEELLVFAEYSLILPTAFNVFLLLFISQDCMRSAKLIPNSLHSLRHDVENLKISNMIQNFSLQLCHQPIIIDACGCFVVDCYIVSSILGSITTYMIFYVQFMPKFKNL